MNYCHKKYWLYKIENYSEADFLIPSNGWVKSQLSQPRSYKLFLPFLSKINVEIQRLKLLLKRNIALKIGLRSHSIFEKGAMLVHRYINKYEYHMWLWVSFPPADTQKWLSIAWKHTNSVFKNHLGNLLKCRFLGHIPQDPNSGSVRCVFETSTAFLTKIPKLLMDP